MIIEWNSIFLLKIQNQIFESAVDVDLLRYVTLTIYVRWSSQKILCPKSSYGTHFFITTFIARNKQTKFTKNKSISFFQFYAILYSGINCRL